MYARRVLGSVAMAFLALGSSIAHAQVMGFGSGQTSRWFVEGNVGGAWGDFDGFTVLGTAYPSGDGGDASFAAGAGVGFYFSNQIYAKLSYRYFGQFDAGGTVNGVPASLEANAHGLMLGLGFNLDLSREIFLEATGEVGAAFINASASQVNGIGLSSSSETNLAGGVGLGLGYRLSRDMDLLVMGNYHWLGDATAGANGDTASARDLSVISATVGARIKF